jgi:16S rRNA processing protein RimM
MPIAAEDGSEWVIMGRISGLFGVQGWVKVYSHTSPRTNILNYSSWYLSHGDGWRELQLKAGKAHGKGIIAQLQGYSDRDLASELVGADIAVRREQLPAVEDGSYYWKDLEGLLVRTTEGADLGRVDHLFETGANDVMVIKGERERLLPFIDQVISEVDLDGGVITVEWDPEF